MRNKYTILAMTLAFVGLLLAILQFLSRPRPSVGDAPARTQLSEHQHQQQPRPTVSEARRERRASEEERKKSFYGDEVVQLHRKNSRFSAARQIHEVLENQASDHERAREGIISEFRTGWLHIYETPLNVEFWELAFKQGIPREKLHGLRRPSDDSADWPAWIEKIKEALAAGKSLGPFGHQINRVYSPVSPEIGKMLLDPDSPDRKSWDDPELQRLASLVERMIEENDWPQWYEEPDWETLVDRFIISEIPDLIEKAIEDYPRKQRERMEQILGPDWDKKPGY